MIKLIDLLKEIKINKPGKIQAISQPQYAPEVEGHIVYKLDLDRKDIVAVGEYNPSSDMFDFMISNWGKGKELLSIFSQRNIKYRTNKDPYEDKYLNITIPYASKYFEFLK